MKIKSAILLYVLSVMICGVITIISIGFMGGLLFMGSFMTDAPGSALPSGFKLAISADTLFLDVLLAPAMGILRFVGVTSLVVFPLAALITPFLWALPVSLVVYLFRRHKRLVDNRST